MLQGKKARLLTTALAVALAAALVVGGGTLAYLNSSTDDVVNQFRANQVDVSLDESETDYTIIPGTSQQKDPTITVANSVDAYVYVTVMDTTDGLVTYEIADGWSLLEGYENVYYREVGAADETKVFPVLKDNTVTYSADLENSDMLDEDGNLKDGIALTFKAFAIQKEPFASAAAAYAQEALIIVAANDTESFSSALAAADGKTAEISLVSDIEQIEGIRTTAGTDLTIDFNGNTVSISQPVGSAGTVTNGMQLLKDSVVTLTDGTYVPASNAVKLLIQNYSDLTLENFTLDATSYGNIEYVLSNNCGDVLITGASNILAPDGQYAFDAYYWPNGGYPEGVRVVIDEKMTGLIKGKIEFSDDGTNSENADDPAYHSITIKGGYYTENPVAYVPAGYAVIGSDKEFTINGKTYQANYQVVAVASLFSNGSLAVLDADMSIPYVENTEFNIPDNGTLDLGGNTMDVPFVSAIFQGKDITIQNGNFVTENAHYPLFIGNATRETTAVVENVTLEGGINAFVADVVLRNVTADASSKEYYAVWADEGATITIESGTYISGSRDEAVRAVGAEKDSFVIIKGGKFNSDVSQYVADGYHVEKSVEGETTWYTVVPDAD